MLYFLLEFVLWLSNLINLVLVKNLDSILVKIVFG